MRTKTPFVRVGESTTPQNQTNSEFSPDNVPLVATIVSLCQVSTDVHYVCAMLFQIPFQLLQLCHTEAAPFVA